MFSPGIEPGTFCVLDRCDNRYTTKTWYEGNWAEALPRTCLKVSLSLKVGCAGCAAEAWPQCRNCRDRLVVRTLRCGRSNPGSNPGHGIFWQFQIQSLRFVGHNKSSHHMVYFIAEIYISENIMLWVNIEQHTFESCTNHCSVLMTDETTHIIAYLSYSIYKKAHRRSERTEISMCV